MTDIPIPFEQRLSLARQVDAIHAELAEVRRREHWRRAINLDEELHREYEKDYAALQHELLLMEARRNSWRAWFWAVLLALIVVVGVQYG